MWVRVEFHVGGFCFAQAQPIAAEFEFEGVAERCGTETADFDGGRDPHLQESPADFVRTGDARDPSHFADRQLGSRTCHADILAATSTEHISPSRKQSFVAPTRTMQGAPARTSSNFTPARKPNSSKRRTNSGWPTSCRTSPTWPGSSAAMGNKSCICPGPLS